MNKKHSFLLFSGLALVLYGAIYTLDFLIKKSISSLENFTILSHHMMLVLALLLVMGVSGCEFKKLSALNRGAAKLLPGWFLGSVSTLLIALGFAVYVNPHARFVTNIFPPITPSARFIKAELYSQLNYIPNIVIFGSSRAFTLSPEYIKERTGLGAFNMSVEGGRVGDYEIQLNRILRSNPRPRVLLIEVAYQVLGADSIDPDLQPLILLPYMPIDMALSVAETSLNDTFSMQSLSDSIYILTLPNVQTRQRTWTFNADGMGERRPVSRDRYEKLLADTIPRWLDYFLCNGIDASLAGEFEKTIETARDNQIAIVLYESPVNSALPIAAQKKNPKAFNACHDLLNNYFYSLSRLYPNVFFRDLSDYKPVNEMGEDGFYDAVHLRPNAAELVVDALLPQIKSAMEWSLKQTTK